MKLFRQIITALVLMFFIISFAVTVTLHFRPLYYFDIRYLDIPSLSGMSAGEIRSNYDAIIAYNSISGPRTLNFPTLPMSENGRIHFEEVRRIFLAFEYGMFVTAVLAAILIAVSVKKEKEILYLKLAAVFTAVFPAVLALCIGLNWEAAFVAFHRVFFDNDYWIFYPETDPVITMLPDAFFLHCAVLILLLIGLGSLVCFAAHQRLKRRISPGNTDSV